MNKDLWGEIKNETFEKNEAIQLLRRQAKLIGEKTNQTVRGTFSKVEYKPSPLTKSANSAIDIILKASQSQQMTEITELEDKVDFNSKYKQTNYKFEIFNTIYRFRLFTLVYSEEFPIKLLADEGICEELSLDRTEVIKNNEKLERLVRKIFSCKKVKLIISRMMEQTDDSE